MIDARVRVLGLILLSVAHGTASSHFVPLLVLTTIVIAGIYREHFMRGIMIISISTAALGMLAFLIWIFTMNLTLNELLWGLLRWVSLITLSTVLFLSLNSLEMVTSLVFFRLPFRIAMAVGVGLRYLPVLLAEAQRVLIIQKHRGVVFSRKGLRRYGFVGLISRISSPLFVSIIRRVDSLTLSIVVQQLEQRIRRVRLPPWKAKDWLAFVILTVLFIMALTSPLLRLPKLM